MAQTQYHFHVFHVFVFFLLIPFSFDNEPVFGQLLSACEIFVFFFYFILLTVLHLLTTLNSDLSKNVSCVCSLKVYNLWFKQSDHRVSYVFA